MREIERECQKVNVSKMQVMVVFKGDAQVSANSVIKNREINRFENSSTSAALQVNMAEVTVL